MARKPARKRTSKKTKKKAKKTPSVLGFLFKWAFVLALWVGIFVAGVCAWYAQELPNITKSATFERKTAITVKAADGSVIGRYGEVVGDAVATENLPAHLVYAVLAIEDRRFYSHFGLDPLGLTRAMYVNVREGRVAQGGSTITQQLAKNLFLSQERTLKRKIQEAMLALWLEYELTKDEILSAYLNRVYMGSGTFGVDAASKLYFNKPVSAVNLREAATLAGLLKAPSRYSPLNNPGLSKERADLVLKSMVDAGYIEKEEADSITKLPPRPGQKPSGAGATRYYTDWVVDGLEDLIGTPQEDLIVETTFNQNIQQAAEEAVLGAIREHGEDREFTQGAVLVMRPNGAVVSMVGGKDYVLSQFNRTTQAQRQPGSSFKPILYLTALERGWTPNDIILDAPFEEGKYRPKNFGNEYYGEVPLWYALMMSMNTAAVRLIIDIGRDNVAQMARRLGVFTRLDADESLALGGSGVSMLELTTAYAVLANGGAAVYPYAITKITSADGETLYYQRPRNRNSRQVVDNYYVRELTGMMRNVIEHGTGQGARLPWPAFGKTGTSQESRDAWFVGFTNELVTAVWVGNDDNSPMKNVTGGSFPARIWRQVMVKSKGAYRPVRNTDFIMTSRFKDLLGRIVPGSGQPDPYGRRYETEHEAYYPPPAEKQSSYVPDSGRYND